MMGKSHDDCLNQILSDLSELDGRVASLESCQIELLARLDTIAQMSKILIIALGAMLGIDIQGGM